MYTIVDVGSNTIRMNVYEVTDGKMRVLFSKKETAGLASYVRKGRMSVAGIDRLVGVLLEFKNVLENLHIYDMNVFATASLRNVSNTRECVDEVFRRTGIEICVISGQEEAELDFLGAAADSNMGKGLLTDIGGGSTELVIFRGEKILSAVSVDMGSLNAYNKFVEGILPTAEERKAIKREFMFKLADTQTGVEPGKYPSICGVGGTVRAALKLDKIFFGEAAEEKVLPVAHLGYIIKAMEKKENRKKFMRNMCLLMDVVPERIRTVLPGMIILYAIAKKFGCKEIRVATTGVREGFMTRHVLEKAAQAQNAAGTSQGENQPEQQGEAWQDV